MTILIIFFIFSTFFLISKAYKEDKIVLTHILYRHGDRSPVSNFPTNPYNESIWSQGYGQLTKEGMIQEYSLGSFLRDRYMLEKPHRLLSLQYNRYEIMVRSTDVDRTLMSASTNLAGIYPPSDDHIWSPEIKWQPIPVHTVENANDYLLNMDVKCEKHDKIYEKVLGSDEVKGIYYNFKNFFNYVTIKSGLISVDIDNIWEIYDSLFCLSQHNHSLPGWVYTPMSIFNITTPDEDQNGFKIEKNKTVFDSLKDFSALAFSLKFNREDEARFKGGFLLGKILEDTEKKIKKSGDPSQPKAYIYSAHDENIVALLSSLGLYDDVLPNYSSCLMVDVIYNYSSYSLIDFENYYINIFYKNDHNLPPKLLTLKGCRTDCSFSEFKSILEEKTSHNFHKTCDSEGFSLFLFFQEKTYNIFYKPWLVCFLLEQCSVFSSSSPFSSLSFTSSLTNIKIETQII